MFNRLKERMMKWLCMDKVVELADLNVKTHEDMNGILDATGEAIITLSKRLDELVQVTIEENLSHNELAKKVIYKSQLNSVEERIIKNVRAVQAIDMDFHDSGKLILMQRVGKEDRVTIINIPPHATVKDYRHEVERLERMYKADLKFVDKPFNVDVDDLRVGKGRRRY